MDVTIIGAESGGRERIESGAEAPYINPLRVRSESLRELPSYAYCEKKQKAK
jgi:hypothetical protein